MFPINPALLPSLRTRRALLVLDLQNDFLLPDGALPVEDAGGLVSRTIQAARAFRDSGVGDVIWVRSEFDRHRPLSLQGDQIITSEPPQISKRSTATSRGRHAISVLHDLEEKEADDEAFLSTPPGSEKSACVSPGTKGAQLVADLEEAMDDTRDFTFTKTHYSAFASGPQLLQLLRGRFVTELYICGALTNISVYATALDAGQHGYEITVVENCCGYRSEMRHHSAIHRLMDLTGCEVINSEEVIEKMRPVAKPETNEAGRRSPAQRRQQQRQQQQLLQQQQQQQLQQHQDKRGKLGSRRGSGDSASGSSMKSPVRPPAPAPAPAPASAAGDDSSGLHLSMSNLTISGPSSPDRQTRSPAQPQAQIATHPQPLQPVVKDTVSTKTRKAPSSRNTELSHSVLYVDDGPLDVDPGPAGSAEGESGEADDSSRKRMVDDRRTPRRPSAAGDLNGSPRVPNSARGSSSRKTSITSHSSANPEALQKADTRRGSTSQAKLASPNQKPQRGPKVGISSTMEDQGSTLVAITSKPLCEGDTNIIQNVLAPDLASTAFERLETEVKWLRMSHQGGEVPRLVAVQGDVDDEGNMPVYRHPADESPPLLPFSPTVLAIKAATEKHLGHPLNHVLIQFYRDGKDYISEHSDKTLDIVPGSFIANVSLGAERTMIFRTKRVDKDPSRNTSKVSAEPAPATAPPATDDATPTAASDPTPDDSQKRRTQRANLPHNSLCRMGLVTNMRWLHAIRQDKRLDREKTPAELAFGGRRISLTFRHIGTYLNAPQTLIWGQGAVSKTKATAGSVMNGQGPEAVKMLRAFGTENHSSEFDWARHYGDGFDVLHMSASPRFFTGPDEIVNSRLALALAGMGVAHARGSTGVTDKPDSVKFVDNDAARSTVEGGLAVLLYLDAVYGNGGDGAPAPPRSEIARKLTRLQQGLTLLERFRSAKRAATEKTAEDPAAHLKALRRELAAWDGYAREAREASGAESGPAYMAGGPRASVADFAVWPVLHAMVGLCGGGCLGGYDDLAKYYWMMRESEAVIKVYDGESEDGDAAAAAATTTSTK